MTKKLILLLLLLSLSIVSNGCKPFFIRENKPKTLEEKSNDITIKENDTPRDTVKEYVNLTPGDISSISPKGDELLVLTSDDSRDEKKSSNNEDLNSIEIYNLLKEEDRKIVTSTGNKLLSTFDPKKEGIYYLETKDESSYQLFWVDLTGEKKIKISPSDSNLNSNYFVTPNNEIYYGTTDGKIYRTNKEGLLSSISLGSDYNIKQVYYSDQSNSIIFSAIKDKGLNLYLYDKNKEEYTKLAQNIVGSFDVSPEEDKVLYVSTIKDSNKRNILFIKLKEKQKIHLFQGSPKKAVFSPKGEEIAYIDKTDTNNDLHNIWIMNLKSKEKRQVVSNIKTTNKIFWHPKKPKLLFSSFHSENNKIEFMVHSLDFKNLK